LEKKLEQKLVSFSKLGTSFSHSPGASGDETPLLSSSSSEHMIETMAMEIEQLLAKVCISLIPICLVKFISCTMSFQVQVDHTSCQHPCFVAHPIAIGEQSSLGAR